MPTVVRERKREENSVGFGDLILGKRKEMKYSLQQLSNEIGGEITPSYINRLEKKEKSKPSFEVVCQLSSVLELDMEQVFKSFGYELVPFPSLVSGKPDLIVTDGNGNRFIIECKSLTYVTENQKQLLERVFNSIVEYAEAKEEEVYGQISTIIGIVEDFRKTTQKSLKNL